MYKSLPGSVLLQLLRKGTGDALCVAEWDALEPVGSGLLLEIPDQQAGGVYAPPGQDPGGMDGGGERNMMTVTVWVDAPPGTAQGVKEALAMFLEKYGRH